MLELCTLGGLAAIRGGVVLAGPAGQPHRLSLLVLLSRSRLRGVPRDRVLALLWPDSDQVRGRAALRQALYSLRRQLGDDAVDGAFALRLNPHRWRTDVWDFEDALDAGDLARAIEGYRGPFLDGCHLDRTPAFEDWVDRERHRLAERYRQALETRALRAGAEGDWPEAALWWQRRGEEDPYDARVVRHGMSALALAGNRVRALRWAEAHTRLMEGEMGLSVDPAVRELAESLRRLS